MNHRIVGVCLKESDCRPPSHVRGSTASLAIVPTLTYAIGAGITAATSTRLVLQLFCVNGFKL